MANVTIYELDQENIIQDNDFAAVSDGNSTRRVSLVGNFAKIDLSNVSEIEENAASVFVDTVLQYLKFDTDDSGLLLNKDNIPYEIKSSIYTVNRLLPNDSRDSRNLMVSASDIPMLFLGKELLKSDGTQFANIEDLSKINNISQFNQYPEIYDYVTVLTDSSKTGEDNNTTTHYMLIGFNTEDGSIVPLSLPNAEDNNSWKYFNSGTYFSNVSVQYIFDSIVHSVPRKDLADLPVEERQRYNPVSKEYDGEVISDLYDWIKAKADKGETSRLDNLDLVGNSISNDDRLNELNKGNYTESDTMITSEEYQYNAGTDYGDSRFARKSLNNLKRNGDEQLYDPLTDWGDNRFAHKALDNLKVNTVGESEDYDSTQDYGDSRFARKNLNNLRSETYQLLNDRVPRTMKFTLENTEEEIPFTTNYDYEFTSTSDNVTFSYTELSQPTPDDSGKTNISPEFTYEATRLTVDVPASFPYSEPQEGDDESANFGNAGTVSSVQALRIKESVIEINGVMSSEWRDKTTFTDNDGNPIDPPNIGEPDGDYLKSGIVLINGMNIPVEDKDWDTVNWMPKTGRSVGDRILRLEQLGVFVGSYDNKAQTFYKVSNVSQIKVSNAGSGYKNGDVISIETDIENKYLYLEIVQYNGTSTTFEIISGDGAYSATTTATKTVLGGSGTGMTISITPSSTPNTKLPANINEDSSYVAWTINDYANVRVDETHNGLATRYVITDIAKNGAITWAFDIYLDTPDRNFVEKPITHSELADNAVENNNILDGTIAREKLAFTSLSFVEISSGTVDINSLASNSLYILEGDTTLHSPLTNNVNLNIPQAILDTIDENQWYVNQYCKRNTNTTVDPLGTIIGGFQQAISLSNPAMSFVRTMIPPADLTGTVPATWPADGSTDDRNWKLPYSSWM